MTALGCIALVGCGSFGSSNDASAPGDAPTNQGQTPADNANNVPPVGGTAVSGVYVSSSLGTDAGDGSDSSPFKKLSDAIALAKIQNLPVNACAETYAEAVTIVDGVSMFGYYDCTNKWARGTTNATIASPTSPAVVAASISLPTRIAGFDVRAPDLDANTSADSPAAASIALSIRVSQNLTFSAFSARAGKGAQGVDGTEAAVNAQTQKPGFASSNQFDPCGNANPILRPQFCTNAAFSPSTSGSLGGTVMCSIGGVGNAGGATGAPLIFLHAAVVAGSAATNAGQPGAGPAPGAGGPIRANSTGGDGMPGGAGATGTDGANGQWTLTADGFTVGDGAQGSAGGAGSGGGGGAAAPSIYSAAGLPESLNSDSYLETANGASGGAGGCAGQAGTPGTGGGASIAAFVVRSTVTFEEGHLASAAGGRAGKGALGSAGGGGQPTGPGFTIGANVVTGGGGKGGDGGRGGVSGHGSPGPSIALAYNGARPTLTSTDLAPGPAGAGQPELDGAGTVAAVTGVSEAEYPIQ